MTERRVSTPPLIVQREGEWWIEVALDGGQESILAPIGDGAWHYQQIVEKIVLPRLRTPLAGGKLRRPMKSGY